MKNVETAVKQACPGTGPDNRAVANVYSTQGRRLAAGRFESTVQRLYRRRTGQQLTETVTVVVIVAFLVAHWAEIMAVLKAILFVHRLRKDGK